jgi:DNA-directed RNA polymerase specialized sigma24 family protein
VSSKLAGVAYPELAAQLGKSSAAVRKVASRAIRRLRAASLPAVASTGGSG